MELVRIIENNLDYALEIENKIFIDYNAKIDLSFSFFPWLRCLPKPFSFFLAYA